MLAAAAIIVLPVVLVFVLLQHRFIDGMTAGAVQIISQPKNGRSSEIVFDVF